MVQFEEGVCDLEHQDVGMVVFMAYEDALAGAAHSVLFIVLLEALKPGKDRWVFLWLVLFCAECVVAEGIEADGLWLVTIKGFW